MAGGGKKKLGEAEAELTATGMTTHPIMTAMALARIMNEQLGGAVVGPWDVLEMPEDWIEAVRMGAQARVGRQAQLKVDGMFAKFRAAHPTYHKYH